VERHRWWTSTSMIGPSYTAACVTGSSVAAPTTHEKHD
jgi:hypothetical protein